MLVPKLRFKREDGTDYPEWTKQKLSAVASRVTRKNKGNITDIPLTIASLYGLVDQREYFKRIWKGIIYSITANLHIIKAIQRGLTLVQLSDLIDMIAVRFLHFIYASL